MKRFLIGAAVLALITLGTETALAKGGHHGSSSHSSRSISSNGPNRSFLTSRHKFNSTFYRGRNSHFWNQRYWYSSYGCYLYWVADPGVYYYWCAPDGCYYPVSYCPYGRYGW